MIIYNVTTHIDKHIEEEWVEHMRETHIPMMLSTGKFREAIFTRILTEQVEDGLNFSVQYLCPNKATLDHFLAEEHPRFERQLHDLFGTKALTFTTELELIGRAQLNPPS